MEFYSGELVTYRWTSVKMKYKSKKTGEEADTNVHYSGTVTFIKRLKEKWAEIECRTPVGPMRKQVQLASLEKIKERVTA